MRNHTNKNKRRPHNIFLLQKFPTTVLCSYENLENSFSLFINFVLCDWSRYEFYTS